MRTPLVLIFIVYKLTFLFGQYEPMVNENKYWIYESYYSNDLPNRASGYLIKFEGDTTINNLVYTKVVHQDLNGTHPCPPDQRPCFVFELPFKPINETVIGYIRENFNEKKVYYIAINAQYCNEFEYVLFDFSIGVNEALDACKKEALGGGNNYGIIDSITYEFIFGETRKILTTYGLVTYIGLSYEGSIKIIEGVGFEKFGLFHSQNNTDELYDYCEGNLRDCNIVSSNNEYRHTKGLNIYPNPANGIISLNINIPILSTIIISSTGFITELKNEGNSIDLSGFANGLYIIEVSGTNGELYSDRVLKY